MKVIDPGKGREGKGREGKGTSWLCDFKMRMECRDVIGPDQTLERIDRTKQDIQKAQVAIDLARE